MKFILLIIIILFNISYNAEAQRSIMSEISAPYLEKLIQTAKDNYPRRKIFAKQVNIAQNNLNSLRLSWFDGLGIYYLYLPPNAAGGTVANPTTNRSGFQLGFSLNVGSLIEKPSQINAAKGNRDVARLEKEEYELTIEEDVKELYYKYVQQVTLLKQRTQLALDAQTLLTSVRSKFERGQETFESFTNALVFYNEQSQGQINTETEVLVTKAQLEEIINKKLEEVTLEDTKPENVIKPK